SLSLTFPDGRTVSGSVERGEPCSTRFFGQIDVEGFAVSGPWSEALSSFTGMAVTLVEAAKAHAFDALPVSVLSTASLHALRHVADGAAAIDERRFRPNILISGAPAAHEEDTWIGRDVSIGEAVVRVIMRDERCVMTTHNPESGDRDFDTL